MKKGRPELSWNHEMTYFAVTTFLPGQNLQSQVCFYFSKKTTGMRIGLGKKAN